MRTSLDTSFCSYGIRIRRSFLVVSSLITGGWIIGTSAMYEYAATMIAPRYFDPSFCATTIEVGPSAAPMIAMEAASFRSKNIDAVHSVKKMPNCAAAPKIISFGLASSGPKSIIAPIPMNRISGNSSLAIPASYSTLSAPRSAP